MNEEKTHIVFQTHGEQSARLYDFFYFVLSCRHSEWDRSKKPTNFWKCKENKMLYDRKVAMP